jgi:FixJ family two-component response regulator
MEAAQGIAKSDETSRASCCGCSSVSPKSIVAVIDDDQSVRKSLVRSIQAAGYQVEAFGCATEFLGSLVPEVASCVVCDLRMPGINGLQLQEVLRSKTPFLSLVFVTGHGDILASVSAMKAGAVDFLEKPIRRSPLLKAIASAVERTGNRRNADAEIGKLRMQYERLTPRERQVFVLVSAGLLNKQVATQLGAAEKTVKQHRGSIMRKIQAESLADLVLMAERLGVRPSGVNFAEAKGKIVNRARMMDS